MRIVGVVVEEITEETVLLFLYETGLVVAVAVNFKKKVDFF